MRHELQVLNLTKHRRRFRSANIKYILVRISRHVGIFAYFRKPIFYHLSQHPRPNPIDRHFLARFQSIRVRIELLYLSGDYVTINEINLIQM